MGTFTKRITTISKQLVRPMSEFKPEVTFTKEELKSRLTKQQYDCTQNSGTEYGGTGEYNKFFKDGEYNCVVCGFNLFPSGTKYDSGSGWPAFSKAHPGALVEIRDNSHGMVRVEVRCKKCGAHLGHSFEDGPKETGIRYCINSACLKFDGKK